MAGITVFAAKRIVTMDPNRPEATHVAVRDGRILAVGGAECADRWGSPRHDDRFADAVLMPGFVEGHAHMMAGAIWRYAYVGFHDRADPEGRHWPGLASLDEVIARLRETAEGLPAGAPVIGWGLDPIFLPGERLNRTHLDAVAPDRPVAVMYSNFHLLCANSMALGMAGYGAHTDIEGVVMGPDGLPAGELQEMAAMFPVMRRLGIDFRELAKEDASIRRYGEVCRRVGVTTVTDLYSSLDEAEVEMMQSVTGAADFPVRIVPALGTMGADPAEMAQRALRLRARSTDRLRLGAVKLMTDGSIQGWTARVRWPGYVGGQPNGIWNTPPAQIFALAEAMQAAGVQMHIHVNGDEASAVALDAIEAAMRRHPWPAHRHTLQHCQMMDAAQMRRAAELGVCVNIFANHIWYFGDQHAALTIGEDRAARMDACRAAHDAGVRYTIHSDAPVTPMGPLFTACCAVARRTMTGRHLGPAQALTVGEALSAITLGAAHTLRLDHEIGSIETGKIADFAVLDRDPRTGGAQALRETRVLGTVSGGVVHLT